MHRPRLQQVPELLRSDSRTSHYCSHAESLQTEVCGPYDPKSNAC